MSKVVVGCKLPNGLIIEQNGKRVTLNGVNKALIIGSTYATTEVDADFWNAWAAANSKFSVLVNGAIFVAKSDKEVSAVAKDVESKKTGLEPLNINGKNKDKRVSAEIKTFSEN